MSRLFYVQLHIQGDAFITIYQCIRLDEEVQRRGGEPKDPLEYKREYHRRLMERICHRIEGLKNGMIYPENMLVPGSMEFLQELRRHGLTLYLASGTDEHYVFEEAELLGITDFFNGGIYGAQDQYKLFSKAMIVNKIIESHGLKGHELIGFGDGYVEIENVKAVKGFAVGLATDEANRTGINEWKRNRLINAGADIIIPDYREVASLADYIFDAWR